MLHVDFFGLVARERDVAGVMAAHRQMRHDGFGPAARGEIAVAIGEADDGIGVADIDPFGIGSRRIKGDAERFAEIAGKRV